MEYAFQTCFCPATLLYLFCTEASLWEHYIGSGYTTLQNRKTGLEYWLTDSGRAKAELGDWAKDSAPSPDIRQAYHKGEIDYGHFSSLYAKELKSNPAAETFIEKLKNKLQIGNVTILSAVKETEMSHIPTLRAFIEKNI